MATKTLVQIGIAGSVYRNGRLAGYVFPAPYGHGYVNDVAPRLVHTSRKAAAIHLLTRRAA